MRTTFRLIGLNTGWRSGGFPNIYATVEYGKEDWFHCAFDEQLFPNDRLKALFDMFKNTEENLWHDAIHNVSVKHDGFGMSGKPQNPIIKELFLDIELKTQTHE